MGMEGVLKAATEGRCMACLRPQATQHDWDTTEAGERPDLCWEDSVYSCCWVAQTSAEELTATAVLAWLETLAQDEGVRARVVREIDDHADYSHGSYGTPDAATAAVTAFLAAAREA